MKAFLDEPFTHQQLADFATDLLDEKFYMGAYAVMGQKSRWHACAEQLPRLFLAFLEAGFPDDKLYRLAALMFQWAERLPDKIAARNALVKSLEFLDQEKLQRLVRSRQVETHEGGVGWRSFLDPGPFWGEAKAQ